MADRSDLYADLPPLDRYCFMACDEQRETGECDCTRRIKREVAEAVAESEKKVEPEWCLRTDGASKPLPCSYTKGHPGPCYFRW